MKNVVWMTKWDNPCVLNGVDYYLVYIVAMQNERGEVTLPSLVILGII